MNRSIFQIWKPNINLENKIKYKYSVDVKNGITIFDPNMGCKHSFNKPNNLKEIYNVWDTFITYSLNEGNSHIAFTINIIEYGTFDFIKEYTNILKMHPISVGSDEWDIYTNKVDDLLYCNSRQIPDQLKRICEFNKLVSWIFLTTEENDNGVLHTHGIISYKNLMDYNKNTNINILNNIKQYTNNCDIVLKNLNTFKDIKNWIRYLHTNKIWVFPPFMQSTKKILEITKEKFVDPYLKNYNMKNNFKIKKGTGFIYDVIFLDYFIFDDEVDDLFPNIKGIKLNKNELNENIFIDLILNYLILKKYFIYNNNIYQKIENTLISYKKIGSIKKIIFDNFENNVVLYFTEMFPCQFIGFDFYYLTKTFKNKMEYNILKIKNLTTNKITLNFSYLEFNDGIYNLMDNKFIQKKNFIDFNNLSTTKYYNKSYNWIRQTQPENWIKGIKNALGENNPQDFTTICLFIASLFQEKNDDIKKNFLYIHGKTNTGKSTYLTKVLNRYYGPENIGNIVNSSNFKFQDLQNKLLVIMDEFRYSSSLSSDFLKLLGSEPLLTTQKYNKDHIIIDKLTGFILSNTLFFEKNENINKALLERLYIIEFLNTVCFNKENINELLKQEEPNIIIFCNKLYFSYFNKKPKNKIKNKNKEYKILKNIIN